jgi:hypothetical protein
MDGEQRVLVVVGAGKLQLELALGDLAFDAGEEPAKVGVGGARLVQADQLAPGGELVDVVAQLLEGLLLLLEGATLLEQRRALAGIVPKAGTLQLAVDLFELER